MIELKEKTQKQDKANFSVGVIVFKVENEDKLLGVTYNDWLKMATMSYNTKFVDFNDKKSEEEQILNNLWDCDVTLVLHAFNPLITNLNVDFYIDYLTYKNLDLVKLPFGYVFKTEYLKRVKSFREPTTFGGVANEFLDVRKRKNYLLAYDIIKEEIMRRHTENGVTFVDEESTLVYYFVKIDPGVVIYPQNIIIGTSHILSGTMLKEGNVIDNSTIGTNCVLTHSIIKSSTIGNDCYVMPFNIIENSEIGNDCYIKGQNEIINTKIMDKTVVAGLNKFEN